MMKFGAAPSVGERPALVEPPASLAELLACIFDAADEENVGESRPG
jgi:hypothetical protein